LFEHDLFREPASTFRNHALGAAAGVASVSSSGGHAAARPELWAGSRDISSTSTSAHGQNEVTLLNGVFDSRSARRHFSFDVHVLQIRHATAKLSSVRGSTMALKSIPARLATDTNSRALDW
jgi:hypothetical protein